MMRPVGVLIPSLLLLLASWHWRPGAFVLALVSWSVIGARIARLEPQEMSGALLAMAFAM